MAYIITTGKIPVFFVAAKFYGWEILWLGNFMLDLSKGPDQPNPQMHPAPEQMVWELRGSCTSAPVKELCPASGLGGEQMFVKELRQVAVK